MIARRFAAQLRRQDWMAVVIELCVVVAGVFIGLQASNWNQQRELDEKGSVATRETSTRRCAISCRLSDETSPPTRTRREAED